MRIGAIEAGGTKLAQSKTALGESPRGSFLYFRKKSTQPMPAKVP